MQRFLLALIFIFLLCSAPAYAECILVSVDVSGIGSADTVLLEGEVHGGARIYALFADLIISGNLIAKNISSDWGGIFLAKVQIPLLLGYAISYGHADDDGGGISTGLSDAHPMIQGIS